MLPPFFSDRMEPDGLFLKHRREYSSRVYNGFLSKVTQIHFRLSVENQRRKRITKSVSTEEVII